MPRILSYTPAWLSRAAPGFSLFAESEVEKATRNKAQQSSKPNAGDTQISSQRRLIAHRGSEVFVAVGNSIRWADLASMKDDWESKASSRFQSSRREDPVEQVDDSTSDVAHRVH